MPTPASAHTDLLSSNPSDGSVMDFVPDHVVLEFVIHRDGRITNLRVVKPSHNPAFNRAAYNAINSSSPVEPLPPEFPFPAIDPVEFTFYYNEFGPN